MIEPTDLQEAHDVLQRCIDAVDAATELYAVSGYYGWAPWYSDYEEVE